MSLYDDLGVEPDASPEEIKAAYRRRAKTAHPDTGGANADPDRFRALTIAYDTLSDAEKRRRYDETGAFDELPKDTIRRAESIIAQVFVATVEKYANADGLVFVNMRDEVTAAIKAAAPKLKAQITAAEKKVPRLERVLKKVSGRVFERVLADSINQHRRAIEASEDELAAGVLALEMLASGYSHEPDARSENVLQVELPSGALFRIELGPR